MGAGNIAVNNTDTVLLKNEECFKKVEVVNKGCSGNVKGRPVSVI